MKLIVGLGNPGTKYENTRHNIGFKIIDSFCNHNNIILNKENFNGLFVKTKLFDVDVIVAKPMTFMNLSGEFVSKIVNYYKIENKDILIIHDDIDFILGKNKFQFGGSSAGQNGIKNIIEHLASQNFSRLRIGINNPSNKKPKVDFVLSKFTKEEDIIIYDYLKEINQSIEFFIKNDIKTTMNNFN